MPILKWTTRAVALFCLLSAAEPASAVRTRYFRVEGYDGWKKGKLEGVSLQEDGWLSPAPKATRLGDPGLRSVWNIVADPSGRLFLSTGDQGQVLSYDGGADVKPVASLFNYELFAATSDGRGGCYVAGAPSGTITHVFGDGTTKTLFDAPEGLILSLLRAPDGAVFVAAGERGRLYRVSESGEAKLVSESGDLHLRSLAWSTDGKRLLAGTDGRGLLEEIDPVSGKIQVLFDAKEEEIVTIVPRADGSMLFAANPGNRGGGGSGGADSGDGDAPGAAGNGPVVYLCDRDGSVRPIWSTSERTIHALALDGDDAFLAATGGSGAIYRVALDGKETILWRAEEEQVLSLSRGRDGLYVGTGNPGRLYRLGPAMDADGRYTSEVYDAQDQARFGQVRWLTNGGAAGGVFLQTRTGYTALPDESWSDWSANLEDPLGSSVASPPGRYLQWRLGFRSVNGVAPSVRRVEVAHVGSNRPPQISSLSISPDEPDFDGEDGKRGSVTQRLGNGIEVNYNIPSGPVQAVVPNDVPASIRQVRSIVWDAVDPDNDELAFAVEIRRLGDTSWRRLDDDLDDPAYSLETGLLPDGVYEIRVSASDARSNPPGTETHADRVTPPFRVDNVAPVVSDLKARRVDGPALVVTGSVSDQASPLRRLQLSVDGHAFRGVPPTDGILDSPAETFEIRVPLERASDGNWVVVRAQDAAGNAGSFRAWLEP